MTFLVTALVLYLVWTFAHCYNQRDRLFLMEKTTGDDTDTVLVATWRDGDIPTGCEIFTDKEIVNNVVSSSDSSNVRNLSEDDMNILLDDCSQFNSKEEKMESMVESSTRMPIRDIIGNSYRQLRRENGETSTSQRQGRWNRDRKNDSRMNDVETTTSLNDMKMPRRQNARTTTSGVYSTEKPRRAIGRNPSRENANRMTMFGYTTEAPRRTIGRNPERENANRATISGYSTEPTRNTTVRNSTRRTNIRGNSTDLERNASERIPARENARRTTINGYTTEPTKSTLERNPAREKARRTTSVRYPTETTTRIIPTRRRSLRTTTIENNLESTTMATSSSTEAGYNGIPIILPSTKWCGAGDIAQNEKDLGRSEDTDKCCRAHDQCNDTLAPGETRGNLTNDSSFTLLSCQCDEEFYDCLYNSSSIIANTVGNLYFNILGRKCYKKDYPQVCKRYYTFFKITCREYESDTSQKRSYNWYPAKRYRKIFTK